MSGRKLALPPYKFVTQGDTSLTSVTSAAVNVENLDNISIQTNITTGTPTGAFTVQVSADYQQAGNLVGAQVINTGNWVTLTTPASLAITAGSPANARLPVNQIPEPWIRLVYTKTSGTGLFDAVIVGKML